jgi:hypothetical protein
MAKEGGGKGRGGDGDGMDRRLVALSKSLSWLLRHGAAEANVAMDSEGYVSWDEIRALKQFKGYSIEDVLYVVENNSKKRFQVQGDGEYERRAITPPSAPSALPSLCTYPRIATVRVAARPPGPRSGVPILLALPRPSFQLCADASTCSKPH